MAESDVKWLHSNGPDNDNPRDDLGGIVSVVELAEGAVNNLFDNIRPEWIEDDDYTDYRCFYIYNKNIDQAIKDVELTFTEQGGCSENWYGSKLQNEEQYITVIGPPDLNGYVIIAVPVFGFPVTCYYTGTWADLASEFETKLRQASYCEQISVTLDSTFSTGAKFLVEFAGDLKNHKMGLIQLIQNHFVYGGVYEYRALKHSGCNTETSSCLSVSKPITNIPATGSVWTFDVTDGVYIKHDYLSYAGTVFTLDGDLETEPVDGDEVWVEMPGEQRTAIVEITREQEGWPIGQFAFPIEKVTDEPDFTPTKALIQVGSLIPQEGFFVWCKRTTTSGTAGCKDAFTIELAGEAYTWP